jgi:hypothetical protein
VAINHDGVVRPTGLQNTEHFGGHRRVRNTNELAKDMPRIRERAKKVEHRGDAKFLAGRAGVAKGGVKPGCEAKSNAGFANASGDALRCDLKSDAECLKDVGGTRSGARGASTVLANNASSASHNESRGRRNVDAVAAVAARSARAYRRRSGGFVEWNGDAKLFHCGKHGRQFSDRFTLGSHSDRERRDLARRGVAAQDLRKCRSQECSVEFVTGGYTRKHGGPPAVRCKSRIS